MKSKMLVLLFLAVSSLVYIGCKKDEGSNSLYNVNDATFVAKASMSNFAQIAAGQIAADSSKTAAIKQYGQTMVSDYTAAQERLQAIASELGITVSTTLDADHQAFISSLLTIKDSATFDSTYIYKQVADQQETIDFFKQESAHGLQKDIKAYMYQTLPEITIHLEQSTSLSQNY